METSGSRGQPDPVSWFLIEKGWKVISADGREAGRVTAVTGAEDKDIFDGLAFSPGLLRRARYVPAEEVEELREGEIRLKLTADEVERLPEFDEPPPQERILPDAASLRSRIARWLGGPRPRP